MTEDLKRDIFNHVDVKSNEVECLNTIQERADKVVSIIKEWYMPSSFSLLSNFDYFPEILRWQSMVHIVNALQSTADSGSFFRITSDDDLLQDLYSIIKRNYHKVNT